MTNIQYPISNIVLIFLLLLGLFYRLYGLADNHAFWTDEEHVAIFTRAILERGRPVLVNGYHPGTYQWLQYYLSAISAKFFGLNEFAIRFPSVIFGVLTIWAVYLLGKELFNRNIGLVAAALTTFLKIEILWSRQARPYQALQFFYLLAIYFFLRFLKICNIKKEFQILSLRYLVVIFILAVLASLMHPFGILLFVYFGVYFVLVRREIIRAIWQKSSRWLLVTGMITLGAVLWQLNIFEAIKNFIYGGAGTTFRFYNQAYYYHSFLWRQYGMVSFLALLGLIFALSRKFKTHLFFVFFLLIHLGFISFRLGQPFVRYVYIVFPFFVLFFSYALWQIVDWFVNSLKKPPLKKGSLKAGLLFILVIFVIANGYKFTLIPRKIYSLNEDMQEIPEVDYKKIYFFIKKELDENPDAVYVSNWNDHPVWYLGEGELDYLLRKQAMPPFDKDPVSGALYVKNLEEFKGILENNSKGMVLLESWDDQVPEDARRFIRQNLKKELEVDRLYPVQPRYWPVEIYSWGI